MKEPPKRAKDGVECPGHLPSPPSPASLIGAGDEIQMWPCPVAFQAAKQLAGPDSHFRNGSYQEEEGAGDPS